jgi:transcriptional regulator of acetoin/glycerol metabolism
LEFPLEYGTLEKIADLQCTLQLALLKLIEYGSIIKEGNKHMPCSLRKVLTASQADLRMA